MPLRRVPIPTPDDAALVARAVESIRAGRQVVLPTETVYGLVARPSDEASVERVRELKGRPRDLVFTYHVAERADVETLCGPIPERVRRLLDRYWPGPLTMVLPRADGTSVGVRLPAQDFTRAVIRGVGEPLYLTSVNRSGEAPLVDPVQIEREFGDGVDELYDAELPPLRQASTVARWRDDGELEVLREGTLSRDELLRAAARTTLFVCSGNTCRSPLAEALARRAAARRLGTHDDAVVGHGFVFRSAGTSAFDGAPASEGSRAVAAELGLDLDAHKSHALTPAMVASADHVYCLAPAHLVAVRSMCPEAADKVELLDPSGAGIPDPFGGDLETYRITRDAIGRAVDARIAAIVS